jgi:hypothetical protein
LLLGGLKAVTRGDLSETFADSIGVNTHLSSAAYASRIEEVATLLGKLGIRHVRDELRPTNDLGVWRALHKQLGIRCHLLVSPATNTSNEMMEYIDRLGIERISAIEGQNEGDSDWFMAHPAAKGNWSATVVAYQNEIHRALRARYSRERVPLLSPTVLNWKPQDTLLVRGASAFSDMVALHAYMQQGQEPETNDAYASLDWYLTNMRDPFKPSATVMVTEAGYNNSNRPNTSAVPETVAAIYLPRLLLHFFGAGVRRTFLYELLDGGSDPNEWDQHWGLARADGTPKPCMHSLANLISAIGNGVPARDGAGIFIVARTPTDLRVTTFLLPDHSTISAIWLAKSCWDVNGGVPRTVAPQHIVVGSAKPSNVSIKLLSSTGGWDELGTTPASLSVGAEIMLLRLRSR